MYSVRKSTMKHGTTNFNVLLFILAITCYLTWQFGINYFIIFCSSSIIHLIIESGLALSGMRKSEVYVYGKKLPKTIEIVIKSMTEGPAYCVPAYFVADQFIAGNFLLGIVSAVIVVGFAAYYLGWSDKRDLEKGELPLISRRAMNKPKAVMLLALINTGCLTALFLMPSPYRMHAFIYIIAYSLLVMLFYLINYNLGVRMVEIYDHDTKEFKQPGPLFQAAGLAYDSAYEMAVLVSPAYWLTFYLGFFK